MSYTYPVDVKALWGERKSQFVNFGVPQEEVNRLIDVVTDMWTDGPGGWCYEWSQLADRYAQAGDARLAVLAYGGARFPCLATADKSAALQHQIEQYGLAAKDFPVSYERRFVTTKYQGKIVEVPVHILSEHDATNDTPVLVATGGIDTLKVDLHLQWVTYVLGAHVRVVAVDIPGTGELSNIAMTRGSTEILDQVVAFARTLTTGKVGQLGMSFGGLFAAHAGLHSSRRRRRRRRWPGFDRVRPRQCREAALRDERTSSATPSASPRSPPSSKPCKPEPSSNWTTCSPPT